MAGVEEVDAQFVAELRVGGVAFHPLPGGSDQFLNAALMQFLQLLAGGFGGVRGRVGIDHGLEVREIRFIQTVGDFVDLGFEGGVAVAELIGPLVIGEGAGVVVEALVKFADAAGGVHVVGIGLVFGAEVGQLLHHLFLGGADAVEVFQLFGLVFVFEQVAEVSAVAAVPFLLVHGQAGVGVGHPTAGFAIGVVDFQNIIENRDRLLRIVDLNKVFRRLVHDLDVGRRPLHHHLQGKGSRLRHLGSHGRVEHHLVGGRVEGVGGEDFLQVVEHADRVLLGLGFQFHHREAGGIEQLLFAGVGERGGGAQGFAPFEESRYVLDDGQEQLDGVAGVLHFHRRGSLFKKAAVGG